MSFAAHELPTFTLKGSTCKTYSISIIPGREQSKILPLAYRLRNPGIND